MDDPDKMTDGEFTEAERVAQATQQLLEAVLILCEDADDEEFIDTEPFWQEVHDRWELDVALPKIPPMRAGELRRIHREALEKLSREGVSGG